MPDISARWVRSRFKMVDDAHAEALTLEYFLPSGNPDPASATIKVKYRYIFEREVGAVVGAAETEEGEGEVE